MAEEKPKIQVGPVTSNAPATTAGAEKKDRVTVPTIIKVPLVVPVPTNEEDLFRDSPFKALVLGPPGYGKTHLVTTLPEDFYPCALVDCDNKAASMPVITPYRRDGRIDLYTVNFPLIGSDSIATRAEKSEAPKSKPEGYIAAVQTLNYLMGEGAAAAQAKANGTFRQYKTIYLDPFSRLVEHVERVTQYAQGSGVLQGFGDWGKYKTILEEFLGKFVTQSKGTNIIMTCHIMEFQKGLGKDAKTYWKVMVDGQMKDKMVGYFNEAYFLLGKKKKAGDTAAAAVYKMRTRPDEKIPARTNIASLEDVCPADLSYVIAKWRQEMLAGTYTAPAAS